MLKVGDLVPGFLLAAAGADIVVIAAMVAIGLLVLFQDEIVGQGLCVILLFGIPAKVAFEYIIALVPTMDGGHMGLQNVIMLQRLDVMGLVFGLATTRAIAFDIAWGMAGRIGAIDHVIMA